MPTSPSAPGAPSGAPPEACWLLRAGDTAEGETDVPYLMVRVTPTTLAHLLQLAEALDELRSRGLQVSALTQDETGTAEARHPPGWLQPLAESLEMHAYDPATEAALAIAEVERGWRADAVARQVAEAYRAIQGVETNARVVWPAALARGTSWRPDAMTATVGPAGVSWRAWGGRVGDVAVTATADLPRAELVVAGLEMGLPIADRLLPGVAERDPASVLYALEQLAAVRPAAFAALPQPLIVGVLASRLPAELRARAALLSAAWKRAGTAARLDPARLSR